MVDPLWIMEAIGTAFTTFSKQLQNGDMMFCCIAFFIFVFALELWLDVRQYGNHKAKDMPAELSLVKPPVTSETFTKAQAYARDKKFFGIVKSVYSIFQEIAILVYFVMPFFWSWSIKVVEACGLTAEHETAVSIVFLNIVGSSSLVREIMQRSTSEVQIGCRETSSEELK